MGFKLGDTVYIKTDPEQMDAIVVGKREFVGGTITYTIGLNSNYYDMYEIELSKERGALKALGVSKEEQNK